VTPVGGTATPGGLDLSALSSPQAPTPTPFVSPDEVPVGTDSCPVGDEFLDASGLALAGVQSDPTGRYGIATVMYQPDYRLIWYTDESGVRHYLIVHRDDPLYSGENGFLQHFNQYMAAIRGENASLTSGGTGAGTIMGLGLAGCLPSVGWGCVVGLVGGTVVMLGGISGSLYFAIFEVRPEREALNTMFQTIEANRGTVRPNFGATE